MTLFRAFFFVLLISVAMNSHAQVLVTHPLVETVSLSKNTTRSIFLMRKTTWKNGEPIVVFVLDQSNELHVEFCKKVLGLFPYQLQQAWDRLIFSGTGQSPRFVQDISEMIEKVSTTPGAIGYIGHNIQTEGVRHVPFK